MSYQSSAMEGLAAGMRKRLVRKEGTAVRRLARGLVLVLDRAGDQWRLACGRLEVFPSTEEVWICARAFGVPAGTEPAFVERNGYWVAELRWVEIKTEVGYGQDALLDVPRKGY